MAPRLRGDDRPFAGKTTKDKMINCQLLIDLTLLDQQATEDDIKQLAQKGAQYNVAALCVHSHHLNFIPPTSTLTRATVINFPTGNESHNDMLNAIDQIAANHFIQEIDYVFPYQRYLQGDKVWALSCSADIYKRCKEHNLLLKVILETGALPSSEAIYQLSLDVIHHGCDFLKTSTGKIATGATIPAAQAMLTAIIDSQQHCGIKLSGGIKTPEQATSYIVLAEKMMGKTANKNWFRIGASSLLDLLII